MHIKSQKDFASGLVYTIIGAAFAYGATSYTIGSAARMGPGYFPMVLGVLLAVLGLIVTITALIVETPNGNPVGSIAWKPLVFIIAGNLVFGASIGGLPSIGLPPMGLIFGIFALTFVASNASDEFNFKEVLILAIILSLFSYAAFIMLLKLQFPVWPTFLTR